MDWLTMVRTLLFLVVMLASSHGQRTSSSSRPPRPIDARYVDRCLSDQEMSPCKNYFRCTTPGRFYCRGVRNPFDHIWQSDLDGVFSRLKAAFPNKLFKSISLEILDDLTELKDNFLGGISTEAIAITNCMRLNKISDNAFSGTYLNLTKLELTFLREFNDSNVQQIINQVNKMPNLKWLYLLNTNITKIPSNAIGNGDSNTKLNYINLSGANLKNIEDYAFRSLNELTVLRIYKTNISRIGDFAFKFNLDSNMSLDIHLYNNPLLKETGFSANSLANINRPTSLFFTNQKEYDSHGNTTLTYLPEAVFRPFLMKHPNNKVFVDRMPMNCRDCKNKWLAQTNGIIEKVKNLVCVGGGTLQDQMRQVNCP